MEVFSTEQPITSSGTRMPQSPRRPTHQLPPRLNTHPAPTSELGPPAQVQVWRNRERISPMTDLYSSISIKRKNRTYKYSTIFNSFVIFYITVYPCSSSPSAYSWDAQQCCKSHLQLEKIQIFTVFTLMVQMLNPVYVFFLGVFLGCLSHCSSTSLMMMTGWFPTLPLWWCHTALMVLTRPSSKSHTHVHRQEIIWEISGLLEIKALVIQQKKILIEDHFRLYCLV